jgi:tRNA A-37 threonylcarbamoyl transferase component Bud32
MLAAGLPSESGNPAESPTVTPQSPANPFPQPEVLARHFPQLEILEFLGQGGMGAVYKARQKGLERFVALKILRSDLNQDPMFAERFTREARSLARLNHPNIVAVYDFGQVDGLCFLLMEFVEGTNLRQSIRAGRMTPRDALAIVPQICDALQFAHDEGIIHRDIKPENILIDVRGRARIADFGLAKIVGHDVGDQTLTATNQIMGTPRYMAPEQIEATRDVDHRADIYSLGVVFYEMLTGELPLGRFAPPSQKVSIDVRLDDVVLRALEKEPERRYQHASDVKSEVEDIQSRRPPKPAAGAAAAIISPPVNSAEAIERGRQQIRGPAIGLICAGVFNVLPPTLGLVAAFVWFLMPMSLWHDSALPTPMVARSADGPGLAVDDARADVKSSAHWRIGASRSRVAMIAPLAADMPWIRLFALSFIPLLWGFITGFLIIRGGILMLQCRGYSYAHVAAILAMLPCTPGSLIGLPCGIWALVMLRNPDVKTAFGQ